MHRKITSSILPAIAALLFISGYFFPAHAQNTGISNADKIITDLLAHEHIAGEVIVKFKGSSAPGIAALSGLSQKTHSRIKASLKKRFKRMHGVELVKLERNMNMRQALQFYLNDPAVEYAEPNYIVHATLAPGNPGVIPDDPGFSNLWGLHNTGQSGGTSDADIDAPEAWDIARGSRSVIIAVVDSGVAYDHPDLAGNIWINTGETDCTDGIDNDSNGYPDDCYGWDFFDNDSDPMDLLDHGTHVAGTIAASGDNALGVAGLMWNARIMALRFLDADGFGSTADAIAAISYANAMGADVINNSWGGGAFSQALKDVIDASPAVVACAAGNGGPDGIGDNNDTAPYYPASYTSPNIIAVAATDHNDNLASFSNFGATSVDAGAPGVSIYSTVPAQGTVHEIFFDDMSNLNNWISPPWGLSAASFSSPFSAADSPNGNYWNNSFTTLTLNGFLDFTGLHSIVLDYQLRADTEYGYDFFCIEASTNFVFWDLVNCYTGSSGGAFVFIDENLTPYDNLGAVFLRFSLLTDYSVTDDGVYVDDVRVTSLTYTYDGTEYAYFNGTSMATPHVAGLAGLVKAFNPGLTTAEVKNLILGTVDPVSALSGKALTGGRINAFNAMAASCSNAPVRNMDTLASYPTLQSAYDGASSGETLQAHMSAFSENLMINQNKSVTLKGGYDCGHLDNPEATVVKGSITISDGIVTIENVVLL